MNNVMVDLETLDNSPTSAIVSIDAGLTVSGETIRWWMNQSQQAREGTFQSKGAQSLTAVLADLAIWLPDSAKVWGNGASFDNAILSNAYRAVKLPTPWAFWNDRCYRTISALSDKRLTRHGTHHRAIDDAISQARHLIEIAPHAILD